MIWGLDLGVRSVAMFGLPEDGELWHPEAELIAVLKSNRGDELFQLRASVAYNLRTGSDLMVVEEPPMVNNRRVFGQLSQTAGAMLSVSPYAYPAAVDDWKKAVVGRGGVSKQQVAEWLESAHPELAARCAGDQNLVDAACIALYGQILRRTSTRTH